MLEARAALQVAPEVRAEALDQRLLVGRGDRAERRQADRLERAAVFGPIPGISPGARRAKRAHACSRVSTTNPAGFSASEATFATSLFGPIPTEHVSPTSSAISATRRRIAARGENSPSRSR